MKQAYNATASRQNMMHEAALKLPLLHIILKVDTRILLYIINLLLHGRFP